MCYRNAPAIAPGFSFSGINCTERLVGTTYEDAPCSTDHKGNYP